MMSEEVMPENEANEVESRNTKNDLMKVRKRQLRQLVYEFSSNTTLHGLRYITEQGLSLIEKTFWFITFIVSLSICSYFIYNVYDKWQTTPVIITFSEEMVPVNNIPFPSVTICPQTKCRSSKFDYEKKYWDIHKMVRDWYIHNNTDMFDKMTQPWFTQFDDITTICNNDISLSYLDMVRNASVGNASLVQHIEEVAEPINIIVLCSWQKKINCKKYFKKVLTQEGVCYSFNILAAKEMLEFENIQNDYDYLASDNDNQIVGWHPYYGYSRSDQEHYPRRGRMNAFVHDLRVILERNISDKDVLCNTINNGYKVYIQHPSDLPKSSLKYYEVQDDQSISLPIRCSIVNTSSNLMAKSSKQRKCYFEGEKKLAYFKMYTAKNCWYECLSNFTFKKCGCVGFYMPHNESTHICRASHRHCMFEAEDILADIEVSKGKSSDESLERCNCLPSCFTIDYDSEVIYKDYNLENYISALFNRSDYTEYNKNFKHSEILVFFQQSEFVSMQRSELFGNTDFIANCGGLLGLFLGFSFLSVVEVVYFVTLRLWYTLRGDSNTKKENFKNT